MARKMPIGTLDVTSRTCAMMGGFGRMRALHWPVGESATVLLLIIEVVVCLVQHRTLDLGPITLIALGTVVVVNYPSLGWAALVAGLVWLATVPPASVFLGPFVPLIAVALAAAHGWRIVSVLLALGSLCSGLWLSRRATSYTDWIMALVIWSGLVAGALASGMLVQRSVRITQRRMTDAIAEQRHQIAAELHDHVAHEISLIVMKAESASRQSNQSHAALREIAQSARLANSELRNLMSLLQVNETVRPQRLPLVVPVLEGRLREAGFDPSVTLDGDLDSLPSPVTDVLARVSQEAINNVVRHGRSDRPCSIMIAVQPYGVDLVVTNAVNGPQGTGLGLDGMRQRVESVGGEFNVSDKEGFFVVMASVPFT